ncbi:MAG TPA: tripartite tricarboxylate transporter substrate binding protein [Casimicrobiaceae bacterium]|nr:tripartite tricarboxylate transporter substrate binding protein [Casimicrobiaceae bacterium]
MAGLRKHVGSLRRWVWLLALFGVCFSAGADQYPDHAIRLIVPYTPGGGTDVMARVIAAELTRLLGQSVIVENKPGAGGIIGTDAVAKAHPDGYTIGLISSGHAINPALHKTMPFDPIKGIAPVIQVASGPNVIVVNASVKTRTLRELVDLAKREPERLTFGSAGVGNPTHLAGEIFQRVTNTKLLHVPYKGSGQAEVALASGEITMIIDSIPAALPFITSGKTRALAVTGKQRFPLLPDVPTVDETGVGHYEVSTWWGVVSAPGTPAPIVSLLNQDIATVLAEPSIRKQFLQFGAEPVTSTSAEFADFIAAELDRYAKLVKSLGIQPLS